MNIREKITGILKSENSLQKMLESFIFIDRKALEGSRSMFTFHSGVQHSGHVQKRRG